MDAQVYKELNNWWYFAIFIATAGLAIGTSYAAESGLPWWALIVALIFAWMFIPIIGTVREELFLLLFVYLSNLLQLYATVGYAPSIENMVQMLGGALVPGKPVANMYFTMYGYNPLAQALNLLSDLKMGRSAVSFSYSSFNSEKSGQYCKLSPRSTFTVQTIGTIIVRRF